MKAKAEKIKKTTLNPKDFREEKTNTCIGDQTYREVNQVSFQQNFRVLLGHYKLDAMVQSSRNI